MWQISYYLLNCEFMTEKKKKEISNILYFGYCNVPQLHARWISNCGGENSKFNSFYCYGFIWKITNEENSVRVQQTHQTNDNECRKKTWKREYTHKHNTQHTAFINSIFTPNTQIHFHHYYYIWIEYDDTLHPCRMDFFFICVTSFFFAQISISIWLNKKAL